MAPPGYGYGSSYRGRDPLWKKFVAAVLILVILAAMAAIYIQSHIVYDGSGVAHLDLPWDREEDPAASVSAPPAVSDPAEDEPLTITIKDSGKSPRLLKASQLAAAPLTMEGWQAEREALPAGEDSLNAVVVTLKDKTGHVYYDSLAAKAIQGKIVQAEEDTAAAIASLNEDYPYTVARLSCLLDALAPRAKLDEMGLKNTGHHIFYDLYSGVWLDPSKQGTADYLSALAKECAAMGFSEILLTDLSYPTAGKLDKIDYGAAGETEGGRSAALAALVSAVKDALAADYPAVKVSVELPAAVLVNGADEASGLELAAMAAVADRVYAPASAAEAPVLAEAVSAAAGEKTVYFVPEVSSTALIAGLDSWLRLPPEDR